MFSLSIGFEGSHVPWSIGVCLTLIYYYLKKQVNELERSFWSLPINLKFYALTISIVLETSHDIPRSIFTHDNSTRYALYTDSFTHSILLQNR